jgi:outer membrane protein TolC
MRFQISNFKFQIGVALALSLTVFRLTAQESKPSVERRAISVSTNAYPIDLPTALHLAGAQNLDIQIARQKLAEAKASHAGAVAQFFPWLAPGVTWRRHDNLLQDVAGNIIEVHKQSYAPGVALGAQLEIGDAIYRTLATKQLVRAAGHAMETERQAAALAAAQGYFDLAWAQAAVEVAREAVRFATNYEGQIQHAVAAGIAFKGDQLRVHVEAERNRLALQQAAEHQRVASIRLAQALHLDPTVELVVQEAVLAPLALVQTNRALDSLVQQALVSRPELKQSQSLVGAARDVKNGAVFGPLIPSIGAQAFVGGLGGGVIGSPGTFGRQEDYAVGVHWRIGPGGLFDFSRKRAAESRLAGAELGEEKVRQEITGQVVEAFTRTQSLADQIHTAKQALGAAEEGLRLARDRKEFAVGIVLETILAEQDLTRARNDYLKAVAEFNKAQYSLSKAVGAL